MKRRIIAAVEDLFFASKIRGTAGQVGAEVSFPRSADALVSEAKGEPPALFVFDLQSNRFDPVALARELKAEETLRAIPVVGFFSHVQTELRTRAEEAGFDAVMPRSLFTARLSEILGGDFEL